MGIISPAALESLSDANLATAPSAADKLGGILGARVERLVEVTATSGLGFADAIDFWTALS